ncbi:MAG: AAA family ATPase [Acetobacteraceae bacterium]
MRITIKKAQAEAIGVKALEKFTQNDRWGFRDEVSISLVGMEPARLDQLEAMITKALGSKVQGLKVMLQDIGTWRAALKMNPGQLKVRTLQHFEALATRALAAVPRHWVFRQDGNGNLVPRVVTGVEYHPPTERGGDYTPARVDIDLAHTGIDGHKTSSVSVRDSDVRGKTVAQVLADLGLVAATPDLLNTYEADMARWAELQPQIGLQCTAVGDAWDDVDGNGDDDHRSYRWSHETYTMVRDGSPSRVVVDVFHEGTDRDRDRHIYLGFWDRDANRIKGSLKDDDDEDDDDQDGQDLTQASDDVTTIPIEPYLVIFDLKRHLRLRVHCRQLTEYKYDDEAGTKLVLDTDRKALVRLLIAMKGGGFKDIVDGKGNGAVILLAGPPGTGKTLTAEVYAEAERRALYSVQCSQLGTDPDDLEKQLLRVFARGKRWGAVMLLDEADVYVHERGNDLQQNAIVGVFLRVLEYQDTVLFMTTNRPDDVDDAIASRCIARLAYSTPTASEQARIWRVLADVSNVPLPDETIGTLVADNPDLSGRDVKNLLKLARLMPGELTADTVRFVRQFQPTRAPKARK